MAKGMAGERRKKDCNKCCHPLSTNKRLVYTMAIRADGKRRMVSEPCQECVNNGKVTHDGVLLVP